ncbi:MAG: glycine oxidase ThiO [Chloroflexota bacterium]|nr:MAG: glycine oxidase ThiO [Chloroflexota bacterium]
MAEAIVVGGGIMGLLVARGLRASGASVTLLETGQTGREASWASAGIIAARAPWTTTATGALQNHSASIWPGFAAELADETGMDIEYRQNGCLYPAFSDDAARQLERDARDARAAGFPLEFAAGSALRAEEPALGPAIVAAAMGPGGNVENRRVVQALTIAAGLAGVTIQTGTSVTEISSTAGRVTGARTSSGRGYAADIVIIAAGAWSSQIKGLGLDIPVRPQRGQILAVAQPHPAPRRVILKDDDPYVVPRVDGRMIVGATREFAGFDRARTAGGIAWLLSAAIEMVPGMAGSELLDIWTGFRPISGDGTPIIGPGTLEGLFFCTGHGPSGISPAPASAEIVVAMVESRQPPIRAEAFDPRRFASR